LDPKPLRRQILSESKTSSINTQTSGARDTAASATSGDLVVVGCGASIALWPLHGD